jgi:hypothetical protein
MPAIASVAASGEQFAPICAGQTSFFFGLASTKPQSQTTAKIQMGIYGAKSAGARAPWIADRARDQRDARPPTWLREIQANQQSRATRSSKQGIAANTAAAKAFPDLGGGGYLGRSLPQVLRFGSVIEPLG